MGGAACLSNIKAWSQQRNMDTKWFSDKAWVAHFDILGFKSIINNDNESVGLRVLKSQIDEVIDDLKKNVADFDESVGYLFYADTFIIYSKSVKINDYPGLISVSKRFMNNCIYKRLPVRGAISFGEITLGHDKKILLGKAFSESYDYGEDQNWLGLILTPSASTELKKHNLEPSRHGFINSEIPLRNHAIFDERVFAYRFINGSTNFKCPLISPLEEMMHKAPEKDKVKYGNTISFIKKYYIVHNGK